MRQSLLSIASYQPHLSDKNSKSSSKESEVTFIPTFGSEEDLARAAFLTALADLTPRGRLVAQATERKAASVQVPKKAHFVYARKQQDICGIDYRNHKIRMGSIQCVEEWVRSVGGYFHNQVMGIVREILHLGGTAVVVADEKTALGVVYLKKAA